MHNEGFQIRRATPEDIYEIKKITAQAFKEYDRLAGGINGLDALTETDEDIMHDIETKVVFVAFMDDSIVGSVRVKVNDDNTAYLSRFAVSPEFQNLGIGKALMNLVDIHMRHIGVKHMELHTASKITTLIRFYYGRGFYIDSTSKDRGYIRALLCKDYE